MQKYSGFTVYCYAITSAALSLTLSHNGDNGKVKQQKLWQ